MENNIVRDVRDIDAGDRDALENVVGQQLHNNQRLVIQLVEIESPAPEPSAKAHPSPTLPEWCNVYEGLSDDEIADVERIALQPVKLVRSPE